MPTFCEHVLHVTDDPSKHTHCPHCYFSIHLCLVSQVIWLTEVRTESPDRALQIPGPVSQESSRRWVDLSFLHQALWSKSHFLQGILVDCDRDCPVAYFINDRLKILWSGLRLYRFAWLFMIGVGTSISCAFLARSPLLKIFGNSSRRHSAQC